MIAPKPEVSLSLIIEGLEKLAKLKPAIMQMANACMAISTMMENGQTLFHLCQSVYGPNAKKAYDSILQMSPEQREQSLQRPWTIAKLHSDTWMPKIAGQLGLYQRAPELAHALHPELQSAIAAMREQLRRIDGETPQFMAALQSDAAKEHISREFRNDSLLLYSRAPAAFNQLWHDLRIKPDPIVYGYGVETPAWQEPPESITAASAQTAIRELENAYARQIKQQMEKLTLSGISSRDAGNKLAQRVDRLGLNGLADLLRELPEQIPSTTPAPHKGGKQTQHYQAGRDSNRNY